MMECFDLIMTRQSRLTLLPCFVSTSGLRANSTLETTGLRDVECCAITGRALIVLEVQADSSGLARQIVLWIGPVPWYSVASSASESWGETVTEAVDRFMANMFGSHLHGLATFGAILTHALRNSLTDTQSLRE